MDILIPPHTRSFYRDLDYDAIAMANIAWMTAYTVLKRESCQSCGTPYWIGHNTDNHIQFDVESSYCYACSSVNKARKDQKEPDTAENLYPVLRMIDAERPSRESWLEDLGKRRG